MVTQMFAAVHYPMSVEEPEHGDDAYTKWVSEDKEKLLAAIRKEMIDDGDFESIEVKEIDEGFGVQTLVKGRFDEEDTMSTYYIIRSVEVL